MLRGFSVLIVLLYHFNFNTISSNFVNSGYIGVDIFFVISGYVITKIINEKKISIREFYEKRFKRLLPVLFTIILISFLVSIFIFDLFILKKNLRSIYSISIGLSNFYFWLTSTIYQFAEKNNLFLLHTWSLAIEFQFYVAYPIIIFTLSKKLFKLFLILLFSLSYLGIFYFFEKHNLFNFYSSFSRIFEITAGCLAYTYEKNLKLWVNKKYHSLLYFLGLLFVMLFMIFLHNEDNHPNPQSITFVIGTCMMLIFFNKNLIYLFKGKLQNIGSISYSLYLWHFPIIVFCNYVILNYNDFYKFLSLLVCILLSVISYSLIEKKFRSLDFRSNMVYILCLGIPLIIMSVQFENKKYKSSEYNFDNYFLADESNKYLKNKNVFSVRKHKNIFSFRDDFKNYSPIFEKENTKKILFVGDSHSKDIFNLFYTNREYYKKYEFARYGFNLIDMKNNRKNIFVESLTFKNADIIVFSQRLKIIDLVILEEFIKLIENYDKKIVLTLKKPEFSKNNKRNQSYLDEYLIENKDYTKTQLNKLGYSNLSKEDFTEINNTIKKQFTTKDIELLNLYPLICSDIKQECEVIDDKFKKNFYDYGHFTLSGSKYFGKKLIDNKIYERIFN